MQEESDNIPICAGDAALKPLSVPPEDVVCVINLHARFESEHRTPVGRVRAIFRRLTGRPPYIVGESCGGSGVLHENLLLDYADIPRALRIVDDFRGRAAKAVTPYLRFYNHHSAEIETEFWVGRPDQFAPCPDSKELLPWRCSKLSALCLKDRELSASAVAQALRGFYTRETHALNLQRMEQAVENATVLKSDLQVRGPLRFRK